MSECDRGIWQSSSSPLGLFSHKKENNNNKLSKRTSQNRPGRHTFQHIFAKLITNVTDVCTQQQPLIPAEEQVKRLSLISAVSAANITLLREQRVARELRVEESLSRGCGQQKWVGPSRDTNHDLTTFNLAVSYLTCV